MKDIVVYEAWDGKIFRDYKECLNYECERYDFKNLKEIEFFTSEREKFHIDKFDLETTNDFIYKCATKIIIHNEAEEAALITLAHDRHWWDIFAYIIDPGVWIRKDYEEPDEVGNDHYWEKEN
jgi:hypothetical protein